jgi:predicted RNA-binding Zn ribbon-like protein
VSSAVAENFDVEAEARLLVEFANTRDVDEGTDAIATPSQLQAWIDSSPAEVSATAGVDAGAVRRVTALRESLRALMRANNGDVAEGEDLAGLVDAAASAHVRIAVDSDGAVAVEPAAEGADALLSRLLLAVERVQAQGAWGRLKACPAEDCEWAFFDASRNRSRTWCSMEVCGNRHKTRRYRRRHSAR